jgi:hypothetical protein
LLEPPADREDAESMLEMLAEDEGDLLGAGLLGGLDAVLDALLRNDDGTLRVALLRPLPPLLDRVERSAAVDVPLNGLGATACATLLAATGSDLDPAPVLEPWIPRALADVVGLGDGRRTTYALACAALGFDDAVHEILHEPRLTFVPRESFGPDARSFARYVSASVTANAAIDDFSPAFTSFVGYFPARLETGGLRWTDLLFAAYGAFRRVAGYEPGEVLDALREFVRKVAGG